MDGFHTDKADRLEQSFTVLFTKTIVPGGTKSVPNCA